METEPPIARPIHSSPSAFTSLRTNQKTRTPRALAPSSFRTIFICCYHFSHSHPNLEALNSGHREKQITQLVLSFISGSSSIFTCFLESLLGVNYPAAARHLAAVPGTSPDCGVFILRANSTTTPHSRSRLFLRRPRLSDLFSLILASPISRQLQTQAPWLSLTPRPLRTSTRPPRSSPKPPAGTPSSKPSQAHTPTPRPSSHALPVE